MVYSPTLPLHPPHFFLPSWSSHSNRLYSHCVQHHATTVVLMCDREVPDIGPGPRPLNRYVALSMPDFADSYHRSPASSSMEHSNSSQYCMHSQGSEAVPPSLLNQTIDLDTPNVESTDTTSNPSSLVATDPDVRQLSAATSAPAATHASPPWSVLRTDGDPEIIAGTSFADITTWSRMVQPSLGPPVPVSRNEADASTGQNNAPFPSATAIVEGNEVAAYHDASTGAIEAVRALGSMFPDPPDGRIPSQYSDKTIHGNPSPVFADLRVDDPEGLVKPSERYFRGRMDTSSHFNILAASLVNRMGLMPQLRAVSPDHQIRGISQSSVPVLGRLTMTVDIRYGEMEERARAVWDVLDDKYISGSFDALVGLPILRSKPKLEAMVNADTVFPR